MTLALTKHDTREAWLKAREETIGGSEAPTILGTTPWASPLSLWAEKTGKVARDTSPAHVRLRIGLALEPLCLEMLGEKRPESVFGLTPLTIATNANLPGRHTTPDFVEFASAAEDNGRYGEIKTTSVADEWTEDKVPPRVLIQVQHMLAITGAETAPVAVLINGYKPAFYDYLVPRSPDLIDLIMEAEEKFLENVRHDIPPQPDAHEATKRALLKMFPKDNGTEILLEGEAWSLGLAKRDEAVKAKKAAEERIEEFDNELRLALGDATYAKFPAERRVVQWKFQTTKGYWRAPSETRVMREVKFR